VNIVNTIKKIVNPFKIDINKYPNADLRRRKKLLKHFRINKILDVGANIGQYAELTRKLGFNGEIISFEPLTIAYKQLALNALKDKKWQTHNFALGNKEEEVIINISKNLYSSSILDITPNHVDNASESNYIDKEEIQVKKLDELYNDLVCDDDIVFLKLDVQGFEKNVIEGAEKILHRIKGVQLEMSIIELYKGEVLFLEMINLLKKEGFRLYSLENGFYNNDTGQLLQVDGIFFRD